MVTLSHVVCSFIIILLIINGPLNQLVVQWLRVGILALLLKKFWKRHPNGKSYV